MKLYTKIHLAVMLCIATCTAALLNRKLSSYGGQDVGEQLRQTLEMIFGGIMSSPFHSGQATLAGSLFAVLNGVACVAVLAWFIVNMKKRFKSGHDGKASSSRCLVPGSVAGIIMLMPTASGFSLPQLVILQVAFYFTSLT